MRLEELNASLFHDSQTDKLTGLSNRRHFDELLAEEFARASRKDLPLSVMLIDVDHFKVFNDTFGHSAGDETLRQVSRVLTESKRSQDHVARYGGEEFVVLLPNTSEEGAMILAERIRRAVQNSDWSFGQVTISLGVCTFSGSNHTIGDLMVATDEALYASKSSGRNRATLAKLP